jgi:NADPH-dependent ferric siderophore reductase
MADDGFKNPPLVAMELQVILARLLFRPNSEIELSEDLARLSMLVDDSAIPGVLRNSIRTLEKAEVIHALVKTRDKKSITMVEQWAAYDSGQYVNYSREVYAHSLV